MAPSVTALLALLFASPAGALLAGPGAQSVRFAARRLASAHPATVLRISTIEGAPTGEEAEEAEGPEREPVEPEKLLSEREMDYVPLATMLMTGDFEAADQFTREALIKLAGEGAVKRNFVYYTEVPSIPCTDLATIELLWNKYSDGKFGYTVQEKIYRLQKEDFDNFCKKIGWSLTTEADVDRKRRWFGNSEFIYDLTAPKGHLPLTNAIRGTTLFKYLMKHPVWATDWEREI